MYIFKELVVIGEPEEIKRLLEKILELPRDWFWIKTVLDVTNLNQLDKWLNQLDGVLFVPFFLTVRKYIFS